MAEYIDREKVQDEINKQRKFYLHERDGETDLEKLYLLWGSDNAMTTMEDIISDIPAADVAPVVHGRWIRQPSDIGTIDVEECSVCGCGMTERNQFWNARCCPNCGARMDGEEKNK